LPCDSKAAVALIVSQKIISPIRITLLISGYLIIQDGNWVKAYVKTGCIGTLFDVHIESRS